MTSGKRDVAASKLEPFDIAAVVLVAALAIVALATVRQYAISNDEPIQHRYGELIIAYYASGFRDQALFQLENLYLYGGLFDIVAVLLGHLLPFDPWIIRHVLCAATGIGGLLATWGTARLIAGPRAGALAVALLAVCGVWYGGMFNHTKDIPFASAMMGATYFLLRAVRDLPRPRAGDMIGFGALTGAALGVRALGLLLVGYAGLAVLTKVACLDGSWRERLGFVARSALAFVPALALAYLIMIVCWPWSAQSLLNPIRAIVDFANLDIGGVATMLAGRVYDMQSVPRWYVSTYLLIKLPLAVDVGIVLAAAAAARGWHLTGPPVRRFEIAALAFIAAFPVLCHAAAHGPAFSGLRHFLFVVPPMAALAGIGFDGALARLVHRRALKRAASLALALFLLWPAVTLIRLHPYEYVYFNELVGGIAGAVRRYDTDYWVNIMPEAVRALETYLASAEASGHLIARPSYTVGVCGDATSFRHEQAPSLRLHMTEDWDKADFFISPTHMDCDRRGTGEVIVRIERLGALIGVVKAGPTITRPDLQSAERH
jgi:hypothetical protein